MVLHHDTHRSLYYLIIYICSVFVLLSSSPVELFSIIRLGDRCYQLIGLTGTDALTWEQANSLCKKATNPGAMLASITTPEENGVYII